MLLILLLVPGPPVQAAAKWKKISKADLVHAWYNSEYSPDLWAGSYKTVFKKNGTVVQTGYRNKDVGTYKISKDKKKVTATFNKCYFDTPGSGYVRIKGYKYTVTYQMKGKKSLYAKYSKKATKTNAGTGYLHR